MIPHRQLTGRILTAAALIAVVALIALLVASTPARIAYHRWQMERARDEATTELDVSADGSVALGRSYGDCEYHRQQLVELGAIRELVYQLENILVQTDVGRHFTRVRMSQDCPPSISCEFVCPSTPEPMRLTVWCYPADVAAWDAFIAKHDVEDYRERFMAEVSGTGTDQ